MDVLLLLWWCVCGGGLLKKRVKIKGPLAERRIQHVLCSRVRWRLFHPTFAFEAKNFWDGVYLLRPAWSRCSGGFLLMLGGGSCAPPNGSRMPVDKHSMESSSLISAGLQRESDTTCMLSQALVKTVRTGSLHCVGTFLKTRFKFCCGNSGTPFQDISFLS